MECTLFNGHIWMNLRCLLISEREYLWLNDADFLHALRVMQPSSIKALTPTGKTTDWPHT